MLWVVTRAVLFGDFILILTAFFYEVVEILSIMCSVYFMGVIEGAWSCTTLVLNNPAIQYWWPCVFCCVIQCFVVYTKFWDVNEYLEKLNDELKGKHVTAYSLDEGARTPPASQAGSDDTSPHAILYLRLSERDFYRPKDKGYPLANTIELLKIKHWLTREAVFDIKYLFCIPIC